MSDNYDVIIIGAGSTGMPAGIFAAERGARVLQIEADKRIGGTLYWSSGQMSAAGTRLQEAAGIDDSADEHYEDAMRICNGTMDPALGRMAIDNASDTLDWLTGLGFEPLPRHPVAGSAHEPYRTRRYCWGEKQGVSVLEAMAAPFERLTAEGRIDLRLETRFTRLLQDDSGAVTGVEVETPPGTTERHYGRNVVLASGGYAANLEMWAEITPQYTLTSYCNPYSRGDGIRAAQELGATVSGGDSFLTTVAGFRQDADDPLSGAHLRLNPAIRKPWEFYVDGEGMRFVREDHPSIDHIERAVLALPDFTLYVIFDEPMRQNAPVITLETREEMAARLGKHAHFLKADSLADLAAQIGANPETLERSAAQFNQAVESRHDPEFGREHMIRPIGTPPFYAIKAVGFTVVSPAGIDVDADLRVLREDGSAIPNLYAAGEALGFSKLSGNAFVGGMSLTPAITFGRLLGRDILSWDNGGG